MSFVSPHGDDDHDPARPHSFWREAFEAAKKRIEEQLQHISNMRRIEQMIRAGRLQGFTIPTEPVKPPVVIHGVGNIEMNPPNWLGAGIVRSDATLTLHHGPPPLHPMCRTLTGFKIADKDIHFVTDVEGMRRSMRFAVYHPKTATVVMYTFSRPGTHAQGGELIYHGVELCGVSQQGLMSSATRKNSASFITKHIKAGDFDITASFETAVASLPRY